MVIRLGPWQLLQMNVSNIVTFTFRAFSRGFYPKRLTRSMFDRRNIGCFFIIPVISLRKIFSLSNWMASNIFFHNYCCYNICHMVPYWLLYKALLIQIIDRVIPTQKQLLFKHLFCNECFYIQSILWKIYKNIELHFIQFTVDFGKLGFRGTRFLCSALVTLSWNNRNWPPQLHLDRSSFPPVWLLLHPLMCSSCYSLRPQCVFSI